MIACTDFDLLPSDNRLPIDQVKPENDVFVLLISGTYNSTSWLIRWTTRYK
jgi:hypothetical protein